MAGPRTRHNSESSMAAYRGAALNMLPSELPTLRAIMRQGLQFQEDKLARDGGNKCNYPISQMSQDLSMAVMELWLKANDEFCPPKVSTLKSLKRSIENEWNRAQDIARKRIIKHEQIDCFNAKLDKLFDITKCRCTIQLCSRDPPYMNPNTGLKMYQRGTHHLLLPQRGEASSARTAIYISSV